MHKQNCSTAIVKAVIAASIIAAECLSYHRGAHRENKLGYMAVIYCARCHTSCVSACRRFVTVIATSWSICTCSPLANDVHALAAARRASHKTCIESTPDTTSRNQTGGGCQFGLAKMRLKSECALSALLIQSLCAAITIWSAFPPRRRACLSMYVYTSHFIYCNPRCISLRSTLSSDCHQHPRQHGEARKRV